jgi:GTP cyclohydrolase I
VRYQIKIEGEKTLGQLSLRVLYSSTCPCSAALSREALRQSFEAEFSEEAVSRETVSRWLAQKATALPHSQRSEARCDLEFDLSKTQPEPLSFIDLIESALSTPVQAAVKRIDEQEFAKLNAQNLMFCEDAARRLKAALNTHDELTDFRIEVRHFESLHAHDVVAKVTKAD